LGGTSEFDDNTETDQSAVKMFLAQSYLKQQDVSLKKASYKKERL
jgi:hypothetical protein